MEPESSLSCSQKPATGPYSERDESYFSKIRFTIILSPTSTSS
jgi:hypothetical protein